MKKVKFLLPTSLILGFYSLVIVLYGGPTTPDGPFSWTSVFGSFGLFLFWCIGFFSWGKFLCEKLSWPADNLPSYYSGVFLFGTGFASLSIYIIHAASGINTTLGYIISVCWIVLGTNLGQLFSKQSLISFISPLGRVERSLLVFLLFITVLRFIDGFQIKTHGDAYICYLTGQRVWFDSNDLSTLKENYTYFYGASWEALFQWGNVLLASEPGTSLAAAQRFAQWTSGSIALLGTSLSATAIFYPYLSRDQKWIAWVSGVVAVTVPAFRSHINLAKNDVGASFWLLSGLVPFFYLGGSFFRRSVLTGVAFGMGVIAKLPYAVFAIGQVLAGFCSKKNVMTYVTGLTLGGLLGSSWILIRNFYLTGNPFFPFFKSVFSHTEVLGSSPAVDLSTLAPTIEFWKLYLGELFSHSWSIPFSLLLFFPKLLQIKNSDKLQNAAIGGWISATIFLIFLRPVSEIRYMGPILVLLAALGFFAISYLAVKAVSQFGHGTSKWVILPLTLLVLANSNLPLYLLLHINEEKIPPTPVSVEALTGGAPKKWIRTQINEGTILSFGDNEIYYALPKKVTELQYRMDMVRDLAEMDSFRDGLKLIQKNGFDYIYVWKPYAFTYPGKTPDMVKKLETLKNCHEYQDTLSFIGKTTCYLRGTF